MLLVSMSVSVDGFIADREGRFDWGAPDEEEFRFHLERVAGLEAMLLGRRLHETMLAWETDPALRGTPDGDAFADVWTALPKVVFSRTMTSVQGSARLATGTLSEELAAVGGSGDAEVEIGGADLAGQALSLGLVDELRLFRKPVVVGGGTPLLPPLEDEITLELLETRTFASRVIYERYRVAR